MSRNLGLSTVFPNFILQRFKKAWAECLHRALLMHSIHQALLLCPNLLWLKKMSQNRATFSTDRAIRFLLYHILIWCLWTVKDRCIEKRRDRKCFLWMSCTRQHCKEHLWVFRSTAQSRRLFLQLAQHKSSRNKGVWVICQELMSIYFVIHTQSSLLQNSQRGAESQPTTSHPAAISSPKPGRKCHIELPLTGRGGLKTLFTQTNWHAHT